MDSLQIIDACQQRPSATIGTGAFKNPPANELIVGMSFEAFPPDGRFTARSYIVWGKCPVLFMIPFGSDLRVAF